MTRAAAQILPSDAQDDPPGPPLRGRLLERLSILLEHFGPEHAGVRAAAGQGLVAEGVLAQQQGFSAPQLGHFARQRLALA